MSTRIAIALLLLLPFAAAAENLDAVDTAVVKIIGHREGATLNGTGFVVGLDSGKATIVTASHVLEGVDKIEVIFAVDPLEPPTLGSSSEKSRPTSAAWPFSKSVAGSPRV